MFLGAKADIHQVARFYNNENHQFWFVLRLLVPSYHKTIILYKWLDLTTTERFNISHLHFMEYLTEYAIPVMMISVPTRVSLVYPSTSKRTLLTVMDSAAAVTVSSPPPET